MNPVSASGNDDENHKDTSGSETNVGNTSQQLNETPTETEKGGSSDSSRILLNWWRLSDPAERQLRQYSFPIELPIRASSAIWNPGESFPSLGKVLFALERSDGPSSMSYDDYKQSFYFPYLLEAKIRNEPFHFLMTLMDWKGSIDIRFRRMLEQEKDLDKKLSVISTDYGLSASEIEYIVGYLLGWIEGYASELCEHIQPTKPFFRKVDASLTIYGYDSDHGFFEEHCEHAEQYEAKVAALQLKCPPTIAPPVDPQQRLAEAKSWIERVKRESPQ